MKVDFSNNNSLYSFLYDITGVESNKIDEYINNNVVRTNIGVGSYIKIETFIEQTNCEIKYYLYKEICLVATHCTSNNDSSESLKHYGLTNLQKALSNNTPLKSFLMDRNMSFDILNSKLIYKGDKVDIAYIKREGNQKFSLEKKNTRISEKIYNDYGITAFIHWEGKFEDYLGKVTVRPEILKDIDDFFKTSFSKEWENEMDKVELTLNIPIDDLQIDTFKTDLNTEESKINQLIEFSLNKIGNCCYSEIFAFIKNDIFINIDDTNIKKVEFY